MIDIAKTLLEVGKALFGMRGEWDKVKRDRKDRLAAYFSDLAALVESVGASLRAGQYPHGACAQLEALAALMTRTVKGIVPDDDARQYQDKLQQVSRIEQLFGQLQSAPAAKAEQEFATLAEAAGYFRAIAAHLRVV